MANSSLILSSLDFDALKQNFKQYLTSQSIFKDYDFDGSNINVLLDVMSYNSYLNSFYLNMVASEMFLDSAQKYDSVVSHAKELNYLPQSTKSSMATISFSIESEGLNGQLMVPKGTRFSGMNSNGTFNFVTDQLNTYISSNNTFQINSLNIFEGYYFQDSFVVDYNIENQRFVLSNKNIDTSSLTVTVSENAGANITVFSKVDNLFGLNATSTVYFLQGAQNNLYEIAFGDGLFGRKPLNSATITVNYRVAAGTKGNGVSSFILDDDLGLINSGVTTTGTITVDEISNSGADQENVDSIKFNAPRYFATQQRAVSTDDYKSLVLNNFGGQVSDITVYGGETVEPKQYGRVIVCIKPSYGTIAPDFLKSQVSNYLLDYIALPNRVVITDPEYFYCKITTTVQYDKTVAAKTATEIKSTVLNALLAFSTSNLEKFGNDLRYSKMVSSIDDSDISIVSNDTNTRLIKRISPLINYAISYTIDMNNAIYQENQPLLSVDHIAFHGGEFDTHYAHASVISSKFVANYNGVQYPISYLEDDSAGNLDLYTIDGTQIVKLATIGSVEYSTGIITINNLSVNSYDNYISIYVRTVSKDFYANSNKIILFDAADIDITVTEVIR